MRPSGHAVGRTGLGIALVLLCGCGLIPNDPPVDDPDRLPITDCEPPLVFDADTTLADLGLPGTPRDLGEVATSEARIRVTRDTITRAEFLLPGVAPDQQGLMPPEGQLACVTLADGSGMSFMLTEPFGVAADGVATTDGGGLALTPILVAVAVLTVAGISWLAFRRDGSTGS